MKGVLLDLGISSGDILCGHSSLLALGPIKGVEVSEIPRVVTDVLEEVTGLSGTIAVPAFNFDFCKGVRFVRESSPTLKMGPLSEYVRNLPHARRSPHPMQSIAAVGNKAPEICANDTSSAFAPEGAFGTMLELDAKIVLVGATSQAIAAVHVAEEMVGVPYRYWKSFTGEYQQAEQLSIRTYTMYVRDLEVNADIDCTVVEQELRRRNLYHQVPVGAGAISLTKMRDFVQAATDLLHQDPWALVKNRP